MKRSFLAKLQANGRYYIGGALILLLGIPLYQLLILVPQGYSDALGAANRGQFAFYLFWISTHLGQFLGFRALLIIACLCLLSLPFTLFRIIVAQEILGQEEEAQEKDIDEEEEEDVEGSQDDGGMPPDAWRGKGFAILAAWSGLSGLVFYALGTFASTVFLLFERSSSTCTSTCTTFIGIFAILTYTAGSGLLALANLFFGAIIARRGRNLWPGVWVAFGYTAIATAGLLSGSAVEVASSPTNTQPTLTSPAILLFALWVLWFGGMLVRLKPEVPIPSQGA